MLKVYLFKLNSQGNDVFFIPNMHTKSSWLGELFHWILLQSCYKGDVVSLVDEGPADIPLIGWIDMKHLFFPYSLFFWWQCQISDTHAYLSLSLGYELSQDFSVLECGAICLNSVLIIDQNKSCWVELNSCQTISYHWSTHQPSVMVIQENWDLCFI